MNRGILIIEDVVSLFKSRETIRESVKKLNDMDCRSIDEVIKKQELIDKLAWLYYDTDIILKGEGYDK